MSESKPAKADPYRFRLGSYGVLNSLGSGGMSSVYRAVHVDLGHEVALKVLPPQMAKNPTVLKRFIGEAKNAEALEHPNIVSIYDRGSDQGQYYLVLEYVRGGDLHDHVQRQGPMKPDEAAEVVRQVARGLRHAASRGLIHRDIKPSNLLRTPEGRIKIADLGLALRAEDEDERVTREGTTVGTVDYMAPEQARDSRATSLVSDIYSLGCSLYYLLTASPPFPGGTVVERLSRHAREPIPEIRAVRPDVSPDLAAVLARMMAKRPEDRYANYDDLLAALDAASPPLASHDTSIGLMPIDDPQPALPAPRPSRPDSGPRDATPRPGSSLPELSLASLAPAFLEEDEAEGKPISRREVPAPIVPSRRTLTIGPSDSTLSDRAWLIRCVVLGALTIIVIIGLDLILRPYPYSAGSGADEPNPGPPAWPAPAAVAASPDSVAPASGDDGFRPPAPPAPPSLPAEPTPPAPAAAWAEPEDPPLVVGPPKAYPTEILAEYLPEWGREPIPDRIDGPMTVVQRVVEKREAGSVASLRLGFDVPKGTIEIADAGPHFIDDARVAGETRLIRARTGVRPVVRIEGPSSDAVRALPGVFALDGRNLTLDSLDLVVNVRDLGMNQRALFHCAGSRLTLKNCTVTIVNPFRQPFVFVRTDDQTGRESRIRIEDSLIRGDVGALVEMGRGPAEMVIAESVLFAEGPIVRIIDADPPAGHRLYLLGSALACRGPCFDLGGGGRVTTAGSAPRMVARAFDCVFGRFAGQGVSSLTASGDPAATLGQALRWRGADNTFSGWGSYFANGPDVTIQVANLQGFRAAWDAGSGDAREIAAEWPAPPAIADAAPALLEPFAPGFEWLIARVAQPRPFLLARTLLSFPAPHPPQVADWGGEVDSSSRSTSAEGALVELDFDTDSGEWGGDLGAFLRDQVAAERRHLRVRTRGSGRRPFTPVTLPDGVVLEMRVEPPAESDADRLVFTPAAEAGGKPLLEVRGGALALSGFRFRVEDDADSESLLRVDDGDLLLQRCELSGPPGMDAGNPTGRLIDFRAASTRPRSPLPGPPIFDGPVDRPVCMIVESSLITGGAVIRAEVGMGLVVLQDSLVAARDDAIELAPAPVARGRFLADLRIDRCTMVSSASVVRLSAWPGAEPGPDRPWLITSSNTAYLDFPDRERPPRASVLFRADEASFARGEVFWMESNDALEVHGFAVAGVGAPPNRARDVVSQWISLWGADHIRGVSGPRPGASGASVRFRGSTRPGRVEPADLILDPDHHPGRPWLDLGADPRALGLLGR